MGRVRGGWQSAMKMKEGDVVRSVLDGEAYIITKIVKSMVVLKSKGSEARIVTEIDSLNIFYKPIDCAYEILKQINNIIQKKGEGR